jgi:hypothetical protein
MPTLYRTKGDEAGPEHAAVVVHCSSPLYQPHFQEFLGKGLGLDRYALIAVPGGAQALTLDEYLPKFSWAGWRWLKFLVELTEPARIILIADEGCHWYRDPRFGHDPSRIRERQVSDLRRVRGALRERFGKGHVEMYFGSLSVDGSAGFEAI